MMFRLVVVMDEADFIQLLRSKHAAFAIEASCPVVENMFSTGTEADDIHKYNSASLVNVGKLTLLLVVSRFLKCHHSDVG